MTTGAFVMLFDQKGQVLLGKRRDNGVWNLPGGRVEDGETPWSAAVRECKEEIGVSVVLQELKGIYFKPVQNDLVFQFTGSIVEGVPTESEEVTKVHYFPMGDLPDNLAPRQRERILLYAENSNLFQFAQQ